ncbi:hypothetical protein F5887DRAFT_1001193 [Amanita rubescens]|nr:hypothetical protein F5887DRAFT_1001193 [Amanita rubescens]
MHETRILCCSFYHQAQSCSMEFGSIPLSGTFSLIRRMRPLYRWLLTFFFTPMHPSTFYARNTHPVPFLLSPGPISAIESSPTRPSVIFLYMAGHNIVLFSPHPMFFALASAFAQFGRHVTRDGTCTLSQ